ncbi:flavin-containing monooxygenase [Couchioplanes azureus]|uniref:flavin-containing monooxygenase n=1 Tax=Couchioplanes caeruleus TaxID=56438 RepID=UPI0016711DB1|nr:NAD(P)-binding domain-containing protein [Couchioplanes caeruleus]GGQ52523.1 flavin-binding monooxygenase [Couchioplanes caeruleus subsp. azureus]
MHDTPDIADRHDAVCVIGAGGSGLAALKNLREQGFSVDCYEREASVGGAWNWRHDRSPVSAGTHLVSSRALSEFPDFPMPDDWPDYPHHSAFLTYLERYAEHFGLRDSIWFGTEVVAVTPVGDGRWDVTTRGTGGGAERVQRYAAVVVANGHNWSPKPFEVDSSGFRGQVLPASAYQDPAQLRGRKVLVVGGGNTGCDIAVDAAQHADAVWHSIRRGHWYAPKYVLGRPADQLGALLHRLRLPPRVRRWIYRRTVRLTVGDVTRFGLPAPDRRTYESRPVVDSQLVHYVGHGRITLVPDVVRLEGTTATFADGRRADPDLVVAATGYLPRFEFLAPEALDIDENGRPDLHLHAFARRHPTLAVVGLVESDHGLLPLAHWQSVAVARWLRLRREDPERAAQVQRKESSRPLRTWSRPRDVRSSRHWFEVSAVGYLRAVEELLARLEKA